MNAMTFDGFEDANIASWIRTDFFAFDGTEKIRRNRSAQPRVAASKPSGLNIQSFIARGIRNAVGVFKGNGNSLNRQAVDISNTPPRAAGWLSFNSASLGTSITTLVAAPTHIGGVKHLNITSLVSPGARAALGADGLERLATFSNLTAGWDDGAGEPLKFDSLRQLDGFFSWSELSPDNLGLFMSQDGNLITNWPDSQDCLIELEFSDREISAFFEADGITLVGEIGDKRFLEKIKNKIQ